MPKERFELVADKNFSAETYDTIITPAPGDRKSWKEVLPATFSEAERKSCLTLLERQAITFEQEKVFAFTNAAAQLWLFPVLGEKTRGYILLVACKELVKAQKSVFASKILLDLRLLTPEFAKEFVDAYVSAAVAATFLPPKYKRQAKESDKKGSEKQPKFDPKIGILLPSKKDTDLFRAIAENAADVAEGTNLVRELAMKAGNDLTPKNYADSLKKMSAAEGLDFEYFGIKELKRLKAGAFLAVAQGSDHEDSGIAKITYTPAKKSKRHLCLVGKGVTFDTGGTNLKAAAHMYGMHKDMAGSAVAFALIRLAARQRWPFAVTAYLAIADNSNGPRAYRPNDVITAMSGKTIEIVHTDAEGRMMLADTLYLASADKPDLILDYATLTGSCVAAIGSNYSGAFTNREAYFPAIIQSGQTSGERVWPFPMDPDYGDCLKSEIADIKQCRLTGGVDHIEAAIFLKGFLKEDVPWIHIDLASADHTGGLGHVDGEATGFGLRFSQELLRQLWADVY